MINLERPFGDRDSALTNWCVITGAPCSGKTAVIRELESRGYTVAHEAARAYMEEKLAAGLSLDRIRQDQHAFERQLLKKKLTLEENLDPGRLIFFDRGVPDSIAYFRLAGLDPSEPISYSRRKRYKKIFLMERLPAEKDAVRKEDDRTASKIEALLVECYRELEYPLIRIPVASISERTDMILKHF